MQAQKQLMGKRETQKRPKKAKKPKEDKKPIVAFALLIP